VKSDVSVYYDRDWRHKNKMVFNNGIIDSIEIFCLTHIKGCYWLKQIV